MFARSATSTSRRPTTAARAPSTMGAAPARPARLGSPRPSATASGMPWMLPVGASRACSCRRGRRTRSRPIFSSALAVEARDARRSCPSRSSGRRPAPPARAPSPARRTTRSRSASQVARISFRYLRRGSPGSCVSRIGDLDVARVLDVVAQLAHGLVDVGQAEGGRPHVDAAAARAQVEGHADEGHGLGHNPPTLARDPDAVNGAGHALTVGGRDGVPRRMPPRAWRARSARRPRGSRSPSAAPPACAK